MEPRFTGMTALITGAAGGIGRASAERLAMEGARVALVDVVEEVEAVAAELRRSGLQAHAWRADVSDERAVEVTVREVAQQLAGSPSSTPTPAYCSLRPLSRNHSRTGSGRSR